MKLRLFPIALCLFFISCNKKGQTQSVIADIPLEIEVKRFDKIFFETPPNKFSEVKKEFPYFFPAGNEDSVWLRKMNAPIWREVYTEVQKKYSDITAVQIELTNLIKHAKYYFPVTKAPKLITVIAEMDYNSKAIYADSLVIISLELYLGKDHKFYQFPDYIRANFEQKQMMPDVVSSFAAKKIPVLKSRLLIDQMVYFGKELYLKDLLLPEYSDAEKIGYAPQQIDWCVGNESYMWRYFMEKEMLFSDEQKLSSRFVNPAPFSKFYLEIDNESPGRVGAWLGWQIVRSYMKNNDTPIAELLKMNGKEIFEKSKYKPQK
jgi:gliding motility-associated lipoprotein GldB